MSDAAPLTLAYADSPLSGDFARFDRPMLFAARAAAAADIVVFVVRVAAGAQSFYWLIHNPRGYIEITQLLTAIVLVFGLWATRLRAITAEGGLFACRVWAVALAIILTANLAADLLDEHATHQHIGYTAATIRSLLCTATWHSFLLLPPLLLGQPPAILMRRLLGLAIAGFALCCVFFITADVIDLLFYRRAPASPWYVDLARWYWQPRVLLTRPSVLPFVAAVALAAALPRASVPFVRFGVIIGVGSIYLCFGYVFWFNIDTKLLWRYGNFWRVLAEALRYLVLPAVAFSPAILLAWFSVKLNREEFNGLIDRPTEQMA